MTLVFVYGTLKRAGRLGMVLKKDQFLGEAVTARQSFDMFPGGGFPYLWNGKHKIKGELFDVSDATLARLDEIEGTPIHYKRVSLDIEGQEHKAIAYMAAENFGFFPKPSERILYDKEANTKEWVVGNGY